MKSAPSSDIPISSTDSATSLLADGCELLTKVLIVDDDANLRLLLRLALGTEPYTIYEAATGEMALAMCLDLAPDLILLDIALPGLDGISVLQQIRQSNQTVYILMVSALHMQKWIMAALENGADGFIAKPLNVSTLRQTVAKCLSSNRK